MPFRVSIWSDTAKLSRRWWNGYGLHWRGHLVQWRHQPFGYRDFTFLRLPVKISSDSECYLRECYGKNWRESAPYFVEWTSPNMVGGFPPAVLPLRCLRQHLQSELEWRHSPRVPL